MQAQVKQDAHALSKRARDLENSVRARAQTARELTVARLHLARCRLKDLPELRYGLKDLRFKLDFLFDHAGLTKTVLDRGLAAHGTARTRRAF